MELERRLCLELGLGHIQWKIYSLMSMLMYYATVVRKLMVLIKKDGWGIIWREVDDIQLVHLGMVWTVQRNLWEMLSCDSLAKGIFG